VSRHRALALGVGGLLALGLILVPSGTAWAHAVLLNSDPTPQATLSTAPLRVRLQFSEAVEVPFGTIRVVDNDGHDVTAGRLTRSHGGLEVDIAIRPHPGTNFVGWQVVSNDGHVERGSYAFYVGAPSKGPARGIPLQATASAAAGWTYGAFRFAWFAALFALVGTVVAWRWVWRPAALAVRLPTSIEPVVWRRTVHALTAAWCALVVSGAGVMVGQAASDSGRSLAWAARPSSVAEVLRTAAGHYWLAAVLIAVACGLPVVVLTGARGQTTRSRARCLDVLLALLVAETVATAIGGHARTHRHATLGVPALTIHLLAVGVWVGGLGALLLLGRAAWNVLLPTQRSAFAQAIVRRFSAVAVGAVTAVILSGLVSATLDLASPADLVNLAYGRMLLIKIVLLQVALILAGRHLWFVPHSLASNDVNGEVTTAFQRSALAELGVLTLIVVAGASLMVMIPGRTAAQASSYKLDLQRQAGVYTVAVSLVPNQPGDNQIYVAFFDKHLTPARDVTSPTALFGYIGGGQLPTPLTWVSDGRFVGAISVPTSARYNLVVASGRGGALATFSFKVTGKGNSAAAALSGP
jgi:copper transport protein